MPYTFGVEIEFIAPFPGGDSVYENAGAQRKIAEAIQAKGVSCQGAGYTHTATSYWKIVKDGSLRPGVPFSEACGQELVSPILTLDRIDEIDKVCAALAELRCSVNRSCGLHVHIGARSMSVNALKALALIYADAEDVIDGLLPPSRRGNGNSFIRAVKSNYDRNRVMTARSATDLAAALRPDVTRDVDRRYSKLNYNSYWRHGTVEFRHHSGTIDPAKIKAWVKFCMKLVEAAERDGPTLESAPLPYRVGGEASERAPAGSYWARGRRTRTIYALLSRPQGATAEEIRDALGVTSRPDIRWHFERAREADGPESTSYSVTGRRNRMRVFKIRNAAPTPAPAATAPAAAPLNTLEALLDKLQLEPVERNFWIERRAMLTER